MAFSAHLSVVSFLYRWDCYLLCEWQVRLYHMESGLDFKMLIAVLAARLKKCSVLRIPALILCGLGNSRNLRPARTQVLALSLVSKHVLAIQRIWMPQSDAILKANPGADL